MWEFIAWILNNRFIAEIMWGTAVLLKVRQGRQKL
jgi:hypothetical protein